jgi:hypothetical protein
MILWNRGDGKDASIACWICDHGEEIFSQHLGTGLIYLLANEGWISAKTGASRPKMKKEHNRAVAMSEMD